MHMDKQLLGLLHASIAMNENSLHASNLKGMPALVRATGWHCRIWINPRNVVQLDSTGLQQLSFQYKTIQ